MSAESIVSVPARFDRESWSDSSARDALSLIAESVTQMVGFEVAVVSLVQDDVFVSVAISGPLSVHEALADVSTPVQLIVEEMHGAEDWGRFKFVSHETSRHGTDPYAWVPDLEPGQEPDSWHPDDALLAPLYDAHRALLGLLSIDVPLDRRRPGPGQRQLLERYAAQAERALSIGVEREAVARRLRLAEATRQVVRFASSQLDVEQALRDCRPALLEGFRADELTIRTYAVDSLPDSGTPKPDLPEGTREVVRALVRRSWAQQRSIVVTSTRHESDLVTDDEQRVLLATMTAQGFGSALLVPIGAAMLCIGHVILFRTDDALDWTIEERQSCLEVARDIGQAVQSARHLAHEQGLVVELRRLTSYKTELLATVSHELKNPLSAITGHLELVAAVPDLDPSVAYSVAAMGRASQRLVKVVGDLLTLAAVEDPDADFEHAVVDVGPLLDSVLELTQLEAERRGVLIEVDTAPGPLLALGDHDGLDRVLTNLVSNALKYTPRGGRVFLQAVARHGIVEVSVADDGIGISVDDQERLFGEFFRSTNPVALAEPGTGLGLAICARIVARCGGRIEVDSELGVGSTFRVLVLQAPATSARG